MDDQKKSDYYLHIIMCFIGGFIGAYALLNRGGNFGSSQTVNLIYIVFSLFGHSLKEFLIRFLGMLLYLTGIELCVFIKYKTRINPQRYSIIMNMFGFLLLNFIPEAADPMIGLLPVFFMMSTQWSVFHGARGFNCSTIFSTNNFRQAALAMGEYICKKDREQLNKFQFFAVSLLWYHLGAALSFLCCKALGIHASLLCLFPGLIAFFITCRDGKSLALWKRKVSV